MMPGAVRKIPVRSVFGEEPEVDAFNVEDDQEASVS
jgi:hypothetical protein